MKKILLILTAVFTLLVFTVSKSDAQFSMGLRLGFNASKYTGDLGGFGKFVPGLHIGPYFRVALKEKYRVSADVLFSTKGSVYDAGSFGGVSGDKSYIIPFYIDVPILFNYKPIAGLYVEAGGQPSIALTTLTFGTNTDSEFNSNSDMGLKTIDFAPVVGVGYEFKKVSLGVRGAFGVTNVNNSSFGFFTQRNMTLMATFGFKFL
jgi:hypothetical protein